MKSHIAALADSSGLAKSKVIPVGAPWQESGESLQSLGRTDLGNSIDTAGREEESRSDFDSIYGDWQSISEKLKSLKNTDSPFIKSSFVSALTKIVENPRSVSRSEALTLFAADGPELELLVKAADEKRAELVGDDVTYIVNRNINFTNVCYTGCRFCAFAQRKTDAELNGETFDPNNMNHFHVAPDLNKIGKNGKTSWDSFSYALLMGHNVWTHIESVQRANREFDSGSWPHMMRNSNGDHEFFADIVDTIFATPDRAEAEAIIEHYDRYWMDIIGTRGFKGKKAKNAMSQFNSLFEVVDEEEADSVQLEHGEDFSEDEVAKLDELEKNG
jgi:hypothetical protein